MERQTKKTELSNTGAKIMFGGGVNFGRPGDNIRFGWVPHWMTAQADLDAVQITTKEAFEKIKGLNDDRLLALVGAMLVEVQLELLSEEFVKTRLNISWAARTAIVRGLNLIPPRLLDAVDLIRQIRNKFAHNINVHSFTNLDSVILENMRKICEANIRRDPAIPALNDADSFRNLVMIVTSQLAAFRLPVRNLASFLQSRDCNEALKTFLGQAGVPD